MADKGKAPMDYTLEEFIARENERRRQVDEGIDRWLATQREMFERNIGSSRIIKQEPRSPEYFPYEPPRVVTPPLPPLVTDWVTEQEMEQLWAQIPAPIPPDQGPWHWFVGRFIHFRHGTTRAVIEHAERQLAHRKVLAGEALGEPPLPDPDEVMIRIDDAQPEDAMAGQPVAPEEDEEEEDPEEEEEEEEL